MFRPCSPISLPFVTWPESAAKEESWPRNLQASFRSGNGRKAAAAPPRAFPGNVLSPPLAGPPIGCSLPLVGGRRNPLGSRPCQFRPSPALPPCPLGTRRSRPRALSCAGGAGAAGNGRAPLRSEISRWPHARPAPLPRIMGTINHRPLRMATRSSLYR